MHIKKKNLKGMTLVEILIAMTITTILLAVIFSIISPINRLTKDTGDYQQKNATINNSLRFIEESVRYATDVVLVTGSDNWPTVNATSNYADYIVLCINNDNYTYKNKTYTGRIYRKVKASDADSSKSLISTENGYFLDMVVEKQGVANLKSTISVYEEIDSVTNERIGEIKLTSFVSLKNLVNSGTDITQMTASNSDITLNGTGTNIYILYKNP